MEDVLHRLELEFEAGNESNDGVILPLDVDLQEIQPDLGVDNPGRTRDSPG